jgi:hypothetical protein
MTLIFRTVFLVDDMLDKLFVVLNSFLKCKIMTPQGSSFKKYITLDMTTHRPITNNY